MDPTSNPHESDLHQILAALQKDAQLVFAGSGESVALFLKERREAARHEGREAARREESLAA